MIKAVLLDLDNTLLSNPDRSFATAFLAQFDAHFSAAGLTGASKRFRQAIQAMSDRQSGRISNYDLTIQHLGSDAEPVLNEFYATAYQTMRPCIARVDGAAGLIHRLRELDIAVVIATNPIYPETAIKQRMQWADLPLGEDLYALITSAETMHFAKPDPAYYAEILGRVGIEPDEALMVGDRLNADILPAQQVGLHTFHIADAGLMAFINRLNEYLSDTQPVQLKPAMIEPQLRGNIGALYGFLDQVQPHFWHQRPDPDEWSIVQILCHLVTSEETVERARLKTILQEDNPFITQPEQPGPEITPCAEDGYIVMEEFMSTRQQTIDLIQTFSDEEWRRPARHSIFGLTTMLEMAYFTAQHDRLHLNQLCQTIGHCE